MRYVRFAAVGLLLAAFALVFANSADAKLNVRIVNNTKGKISVALAVAEEGAMALTKGWYDVDAGGDASFVWDVKLPQSSEPFIGYYAMNSPKKGEEKSYWRGRKGEGRSYPIQPAKTFDYRHALDDDDFINNYGSDAQFVDFVKAQHKTAGDGSASATLTFK